ncbi:MAG: GrpB family protein [Candidatus Izemoplasmatales bacterium]
MGKPLSKMTLTELWELFPIVIVDYDPVWADWYKQEEISISKALGLKIIRRINHIGSTSVPNLSAKPTVDILLEITQDVDPQPIIKQLHELGWSGDKKRTLDSPDLIMLKKGYTPLGYADKVFHLHIRYYGDWDELYFRDYLRNHSDVALEYAKLKKTLRSRFEHDRDGYTEGKTDFIKQHTYFGRQQFPKRYQP